MNKPWNDCEQCENRYNLKNVRNVHYILVNKHKENKNHRRYAAKQEWQLPEIQIKWKVFNLKIGLRKNTVQLPCNNRAHWRWKRFHILNSRSICSIQTGLQFMIQFIEMSQVQHAILWPASNSQHSRISFHQLRIDNDKINHKFRTHKNKRIYLHRHSWRYKK